MTRTIPVLVLLFLLLSIGTVAATTESQISQVSTFDVSANNGMVIDKIIIDAVPPLTNETVLLYSGTELQTLTIESWKETIFHWHFHITLDNGSYIDTKDLDEWSPAVNYRTTIQPVTLSAAGTIYNPIVSISLYIGTKSLRATLQVPPAVSTYTIMGFSRVTGTISNGTKTDVFIDQDTYEHFQNVIAPQSFSGLLGDAIAGLASWTWSAILAAVSLIPFVGPYFQVFLEMAAALLGEIVYWFLYAIAHAVPLGFGIESVVLMVAGLNGNFRPGKVIGLIVSYNVAIVNFIILFFMTGYNIVLFLIQAVGAIK